VWMANFINKHRDQGYIASDDLFYESAEYRHGTSQHDSEDAMKEFERMSHFTMEMTASHATSHVMAEIPIQAEFIRAAVESSECEGSSQASSINDSQGADEDKEHPVKQCKYSRVCVCVCVCVCV